MSTECLDDRTAGARCSTGCSCGLLTERLQPPSAALQLDSFHQNRGAQPLGDDLCLMIAAAVLIDQEVKEGV